MLRIPETVMLVGMGSLVKPTSGSFNHFRTEITHLIITKKLNIAFFSGGKSHSRNSNIHCKDAAGHGISILAATCSEGMVCLCSGDLMDSVLPLRKYLFPPDVAVLMRSFTTETPLPLVLS